MTRRLVASLVFAALAFAQEIGGKWNFVWQTPGGERRSTLTITLDGEKVSVMFPDAKAPVAGTFRNGKLAAAGKLYSAEAGEEGDFQMSATLSGGVLKGTSSWQEHAMTFTAQRAEGSK